MRIRRFKQGDLVVYRFNFEEEELRGIVVSAKPSPGVFRDSTCFDQVHALEVLWDRDVPSWMGEGKIAYVTDSVVQRLEDVIDE